MLVQQGVVRLLFDSAEVAAALKPQIESKLAVLGKPTTVKVADVVVDVAFGAAQVQEIKS